MAKLTSPSSRKLDADVEIIKVDLNAPARGHTTPIDDGEPITSAFTPDAGISDRTKLMLMGFAAMGIIMREKASPEATAQRAKQYMEAMVKEFQQ